MSLHRFVDKHVRELLGLKLPPCRRPLSTLQWIKNTSIPVIFTKTHKRQQRTGNHPFTGLETCLVLPKDQMNLMNKAISNYLWAAKTFSIMVSNCPPASASSFTPAMVLLSAMIDECKELFQVPCSVNKELNQKSKQRK